jgi:hypothetical protein
MRALDELERRFVEAIESEAVQMQTRGRRRRWVRPVGIAAGVLTAAVVAVILLVAGAGEVVRPTAAQALERAARTAAASAAAPNLHAGEYWYVRAEGTAEFPSLLDPLVRGGGKSMTFIETSRPVITETWVGTERKARSRTLMRGPVEITSASDRARWQAAGSPSLDQPSSNDTIFTKVRGLPVGLGMLSYAEVRGLPTDPRALLTTLAVAARRSSTARSAPRFGPAILALTEFRAISGLLVAPVDPAVRAALFRAAALIPGVRDLGTRADAIGRRGVAVGLDWRGGIVSELIFDPRTAALLGVDIGEDRGGLAYIASGLTQSIRSLPAGVKPVAGPLPPVRYTNPPTRHR